MECLLFTLQQGNSLNFSCDLAGSATGGNCGNYHNFANYIATSRCKLRKKSCPPQLSCEYQTPSTPPPSPVIMHPGFSRQNSSPSHNSLSLNPSPVPSLELIPLNNQMETLVSAIPDTCPNIKALLALKILNPEFEETDSNDGSQSPNSTISSHNYLTYPLKQNYQTNNHIPGPGTLSTNLNITKSTPRITRKNTMEVVTEESDDVDDAHSSKSPPKSKSMIFLNSSTNNTINVSGHNIRKFDSTSTPIAASVSLLSSRPSFASNESMNSCASVKSNDKKVKVKENTDGKCRVI